MNPIVSVIVAVYNTEAYLTKCVESITGQTYKDLEIILVDDGSTDGSGAICDDLAGKDDRIVVIHKENGGLSSARNAALDVMKGQYIAFIDSDDYIDETYIEYLYGLIKDNDAQAAECKYRHVFEDDTKPLSFEGKFDKIVYSGEEAVIQMFYQKTITNFACCKMFGKELFEDIRFPVGTQYEDLGTVYKTFLKADKVAVGGKAVYNYFQRSGSIMHSNFSMKKMDRIKVSSEIMHYMENRSKALQDAAECRMFVSAVQVLREIPLEDETYKPQFNEISELINRHKKNVFRNKNAKKINRLIALSLILFRPAAIKKLGNLYKFVYRN